MESSFLTYLGIPDVIPLMYALLSCSPLFFPFLSPVVFVVVVDGGGGEGALGVGEGVDEDVGVGVDVGVGAGADSASFMNSGGGGGRTKCWRPPEKDLL